MAGNAAVHKSLVIVRILLALLVILLAGFWGLIVLFSDSPPSWPNAFWALYVLGGHLIAGLLVGMLIPLRWRLSIAAAWGAIFINVGGLVGMLRSGESAVAPTSLLARLAFPLLTLLIVPAVAGLGGYAGSRVVKG
jgi:hypothetical protein